MTNRPGLDFSFSGLKTFVRNTIAEEVETKGELNDAVRAISPALLRMPW